MSWSARIMLDHLICQFTRIMIQKEQGLTEMIISGERVKQARELKGWTQAVLARAVGVSQAAIAQIESGAFMASDELVAEIAKSTGQPLQFFQQDPAPEFPVGSLLFRSHASLTKKDLAVRSEERRVGKEWRSRWAAD